MKKMIFIITYMLIITVSLNTIAESSVKKKHKVDVKCHVELMDGKEIIYFARIKVSEIKKLLNTLPKRRVLTSISKDKKKINKVFECVPLTEKFYSLKANRLFEKQPR